MRAKSRPLLGRERLRLGENLERRLGCVLERRVERRVEPHCIKIPQVGSTGVSPAIPTAMIVPTISSIRSRLRSFDGFQLSATTVSSDTLFAIRRSTGSSGAVFDRNVERPGQSLFFDAAKLLAGQPKYNLQRVGAVFVFPAWEVPELLDQELRSLRPGLESQPPLRQERREPPNAGRFSKRRLTKWAPRGSDAPAIIPPP
jgi:hypothetical protein